MPITDVRRGLLALTLSLHLILHRLSATLKTHPLHMVVYLVVQFGLLAALSVLVNTPLVLIFNTPLLGEVILMFDVIWIAFLEMLFAYSVYIVMLTVIYHFNGAIFIQFFGPGLLLSTISALPYLGVLILQVATRRRSDQLVTELRAAHRQLTRYASQVEELTLAAERARMARDLHDTLAQGLAGMTLQLEALEGSLARGDTQRALMILGQVKSNARATLTGSRHAIDALRLVTIQNDSGGAAIRAEVKRFSEVYGIPCTLDMPYELTFSAIGAEPLLRCISEGLTNIGRHAHASVAMLSLRRQEGEIIVQLTDNGVGFDPQSINSATSGPAGHYGLIGMDERIRLVGGRVVVISAPGAGTTLRLILPEFGKVESD